MDFPAVQVNYRGARRIHAGHLWIYQSDVRADDIPSGSVVRITDGRGRHLGWGFYSSASLISIRVLSRDEPPIDRQFWKGRLQRAGSLRENQVTDSTAYRLVNSDGDFLSSIIVDRYEDYLVMQNLSQGAETLKPMLVELLVELFRPKAIVERNDARVRKLEGLEERKGVLDGRLPERVNILEKGIRYAVDLLGGQKTGAFLDQRENRIQAEQYAAGRALDCFAYEGGFALHLARYCPSVTAVEISAEALENARANLRLNQAENVELVEANAFDFLHQQESAGEHYRAIVLDPPAFAKSREAIESAARGYKEINLRALKLLEPGGVLITSSCSYHVTEDLFWTLLIEAAADAGRTVQLVEKRAQASDHPMLLSMPETHYLKCFILRVF